MEDDCPVLKRVCMLPKPAPTLTHLGSLHQALSSLYARKAWGQPCWNGIFPSFGVV